MRATVVLSHVVCGLRLVHLRCTSLPRFCHPVCYCLWFGGPFRPQEQRSLILTLYSLFRLTPLRVLLLSLTRLHHPPLLPIPPSLGAGVASGDGGPFGALVLHPPTGKVVSLSHNCVLKSNDPTAHAEVVAIRAASAARGTWDLSDCVLYASCRPCPMCYGAAAWAKLPRVEYAARAEDAAGVGFDDKAMWDAVGREGGGGAAAAAAADGNAPSAAVAMVVVHAAHERKMEPFYAFLRAKEEGKSSLY